MFHSFSLPHSRSGAERSCLPKSQKRSTDTQLTRSHGSLMAPHSRVKARRFSRRRSRLDENEKVFRAFRIDFAARLSKALFRIIEEGWKES